MFNSEIAAGSSDPEVTLEAAITAREALADVGGTWPFHTYPGAAIDTPSRAACLQTRMLGQSFVKRLSSKR